jgi:hypothetical protein
MSFTLSIGSKLGLGRVPIKRGLMFVDPHGEAVAELARLKCMQDDLVVIDPRVMNGSCPIINPFDAQFSTFQELHLYAECLADAFVSMMSKDEEGLSGNMRTFLTPCLTVLLMRGNSTFHDLARLLQSENIADLLSVASRVRYLREFFS